MFLVERLTVDLTKSHPFQSLGYKQIGVVTTAEEANRICSLGYVENIAKTWPPRCASEFAELYGISLFSVRKIENVTGFTAEQLKELP